MCCLGAKIDWVQCDGCELWYHLKCVGLTPDQCSDDDEYHCPSCARRSLPPAATVSLPTPSRHVSKLPSSLATPSLGSSPVKRKTPKRSDRKDPLPNSKSKASTATKTVVPSATPVFETAKQTVAVSLVVSSKDTPSQSVDSNPSRTVATGGFAAFARPGSFGGAKLFEFSTLAENAVRRPSVTCSTSSSRGDTPAKSLSATTGSSFTFGQYLYTPWLAKSALAPR